MAGRSQQSRFVEHARANGEVLVVMRYRIAMDRRMRNCIVRMLGRIRQPGTEGKCLGVTNQVRVVECPPGYDWRLRNDWCLAIFFFPSEENARRWYNSEPELKQPDFLPPSDGVQLFVVKLRYLPNINKNRLTFNWMEMHNVHSKAHLQTQFVDKVAPILDDEHVNHGMAFVHDPSELYVLKESWISHNADAYCVVNVFEDEEQFDKLCTRPGMVAGQQGRNEVCDTVNLVFTIDSNITGPPSPRA